MTMNELSLACQQLEAVLIECDSTMDALDCAYTHGYLTAIAISPEPLTTSLIINDLLEDNSLSDEQYSHLSKAITQETKAIDRMLNSEEESADITPSDSESLVIWCAGFLEVHFQQDDIWLKGQEQAVSELILPIMLLSGLFDNEPEFKSMAHDEQLLEDMQGQLSEVMTELYLLFRE